MKQKKAAPVAASGSQEAAANYFVYFVKPCMHAHASIQQQPEGLNIALMNGSNTLIKYCIPGRCSEVYSFLAPCFIPTKTVHALRVPASINKSDNAPQQTN